MKTTLKEYRAVRAAYLALRASKHNHNPDNLVILANYLERLKLETMSPADAKRAESL